MYQLVFTLLLCWLALPVLAQQQLAKARQSSYLTKVFRLTTAQAQRLYERGLQAARPDFFTVAVDSFPSDKPAWPRLPLGYYLVAHTEGPELVYWLRAETSRTLQVIDNQTDLTLAVRDSLGQLIAGAQVAVGGRPLPYDPATRTYRRARPSRAGIVAVTAGGRTTFHPLAQTYRQPGHFNWRAGGWLRVGRRVLYGRPLGYVTGPVWRTVRDLKHASSTTTGLVGLLRSPFKEDVRDERQRRREQRRDGRPTRAQQKWQSYLVVSQPRYRPTHDTLRLKARVLRRGSGRPSTRPLTLWLSNDGLARRKRLASLRPVRPGSYEFSLPLTDTLGLRVGTTASLSLEDEGGHALAEGDFKFEDYELNNSTFTMRMLEKEPRRGQPQAVFLRGTDASELNLLDARVRLAVVPSSGPRQVLGRRLFVPDTLWTHTQTLDPTGETRVNLPADVFPNAELTYEVQATFLTADNERHVETASLLYALDPGRLHLTLDDDSVRLSYDSLGLPRPHRARLEIARLNPAPGDSLYFRSGPVRLPLALPVNPQAAGYRVRDAAGRAAEVYLRSDNAGLTLGSARTADSLRLAVANPHGLPFWYYVYRDNALRYRGYGTAYQLAIRESNVATWHVSLHYPWGGALQTAEYSVGPVQRALHIEAEQPAVAYPGQRLRLGFVVTDEHGRPVPDADLTAYAYSSKFAQSTLPTIPDPAPPVPGRVARQRFALAATFSHYTTQRQRLAWQQWHHQLGLDSLQFYHFLYPAEGAFYEYRPAPGGLTQVAVFVVDSGRVQAPIAVYVDGQPAYIHDINENQPYVAVADSGHHTLSIRTANRLITLRDVYLLARHKLTLGLDPNYACAELRVEKRPTQLQPDELLALRRTLVAVRGQVPSTLRQGAVLRPLAGGYGRYYAGLTVAGPFAPDSLLLRPLRAEDGAANGGRRKFLFEPLYRYQFTPGVVKMDCLDPTQLGPLNGAGLSTPLPLGEFAYTEAALRPWEYAPATPNRPALKQRQRRASRPAPFRPRQGPPQLTYPDRTLAGQGRLQLLLPDSIARPLYVLLTRPDQPKFQRLQPAHELAQGLAPGRYRVAVLLADSSCLLPQDLVLTPADGQTYFRLRRTERRLAPALSHRLNQWLWRLTPVVARPVVAPEQRKIQVTQPGRPGLNTCLVHGRVVARDTEEGLPGVTVLVKNSSLGTSTGADGSFVLHVPMDTQTLVFSSVGYVTQEQALDYTGKLSVVLSESTQQLSEVVVTGYEARTRREITGSVSSVTSYSLQGRVAGVSISGAPANVLIRGMATVAAGEQPLYIVNGLPFSGKLADISPDDIQEMKVLKGPEAAATYGARASGGVVLITLKSKAGLAGQPAGSDLLPGADPRLALRRHFSDHAWWRPTLVTDGQGRAHTSVVLPDDVTSWETFVIGSDNHRRIGTATGRVRAFKSLLATLSGPRFLVAGDRVQLLGKALNYQPDTAQLTATFRVGGQVVRRQAHRVATALLDTLTVTAPAAADSLQVAFGLEQASGYADGEQRSLPVLPVGTRERVGTYAVLTAPDTTITLPLNPGLGAVQLRVESDALPTLLAEIHHLQEYAYLCNEQAASRLLGLLLEQQIASLQGTVFKGQKVVNFLIKKLQDGRHQPEGIWGTWPASEVSPWATVHVVEALLAAEKQGYAAGLDRPALHAYLLHELDESLGEPTPAPGHRYRGHFGADDDQIRLLKLLHELGAPANYGTYLRRIEASAPRRPPLDRYLALTELRQQLGLSYQLDTLRHYRLPTELGGVSYGDTLHQSSYYHYLLADRVGTTLLAYKVLRHQGGHAAELARIRTYLLGLRGGGYWESTYETAQILTTIGPDLLVPGSGGKAAVVQLSGSPALPAGPVAQFPLALTLPAGTGALTLRKQGGLPVYATAYQTRWNPAPAAAAPFTVHTTLAGQASGRVSLPAGQPAELEVTVDVKADVRYALLEVPIPAGCSYGPPAPANYLETHREYLKHQVGIFIDHLPAGRHTFQVALQPRYRGSYTLNPARLEMVYFPTKYGRTAGKRVEIK